MSKVNLDSSWKEKYSKENFTDNDTHYMLIGASEFQQKAIHKLSQINKSDSMTDKLARLKVIEIIKNLKA